MKRIRVTVTQEDIDSGVRMDAFSCPLAIALTRTTGETCCVVRGWRYHGPYGQHSSGGELSPDAVAFVHAFDAREPVAPATFLLPVPE